MSRRRAHPVLKWIGAALCVLTVGAFIVSLRWNVKWTNATGECDAGLVNGALCFVRVQTPKNIKVIDLSRMARGWSICPLTPGTRKILMPRAQTFLTRGPIRLKVTRVNLPTWMPPIVFGVPTALLWWRDRHRIPPGHCRKCGYDLTGNVSGRCPECGESTLAPDGCE